MTVWSSKKAPGYVSLVDADGNVIGTDTNPLKTSGSGGGGGTQDVNITGQTAGLATAAGQQDIVNAIEALGGGDTSSAIYSGTANVTTTASALTAQAIGEVIVQNDADSTNDIFIGNNTAQDWRLKPGEWVSVKVSNLNLIYAKTSTGTATLRYFARSAAGIGGGGGSPVPVQLTGSIVPDSQPVPVKSVRSNVDLLEGSLTTVAAGANFDVTIDLRDYAAYNIFFNVVGTFTWSATLRHLKASGVLISSSTAINDIIVASASQGPKKTDPAIVPKSPQVTIRFTNGDVSDKQVAIYVSARRG